ncbi:MAG TPA: glycine cleavage system protein H [Solirubrobacteraceae bacterium]|nr:glycine cleavage system protein H [Solirubrobacteraceae bacterium]
MLVAGYDLDPGLAYEPETNLWVAELGDGRARVGYDPLGAETTGDVVAISFAAPGVRVERGESLGTVEAAKFVGPLAAPVGGVLVAGNPAVLDAPGSVNADPFGAWLVELTDIDAGDLARLVRGPEAITPWFAAAVERFRRAGAIAQ